MIAASLAGIATAVAISLGILGIVATVYVDHRRHSDRMATPAVGKLRPIRKWRPDRFYRGRACLDQYILRLRGYVPGDDDMSLDDLRKYALHALVATAAWIHPSSQGKANLFKLKAQKTGPGGGALLSPLTSAGLFPLHQVSSPKGKNRLGYRDIGCDPDATLKSPFAVVECVRVNQIMLHNVRNGDTRSDDELRIGTTEIVAIPICEDIRAAELDSLMALAIDLRMSRLRAALIKARWHPEQKRRSELLKRAEVLQTMARELAELVETAG